MDTLVTYVLVVLVVWSAMLEETHVTSVSHF